MVALMHDNLMAAVAAVYPELRQATARRLDHDGQNSHVLLVAERFIFRFPRYVEGMARVEAEATILQAIAGQLPLATPDPRYLSFHGKPGQAFIGYPVLPGDTLSGEDVDTAGAARRVAWGEQLGKFLRSLHNVPFAMPRPQPVADTHDDWTRLWNAVQEQLFPLMSAAGRARARAEFSSVLATPERFAFIPALRHGDFGTGNLLIDRSSHRLCGVIDFGAAAMGDPAVDVAAVWTMGDEVLRGVIHAYPEATDMLYRARFIRGTFALQEALHGRRYDDAEALAAGLEEYD